MMLIKMQEFKVYSKTEYFIRIGSIEDCFIYNECDALMRCLGTRTLMLEHHGLHPERGACKNDG